MLRGERAMAGGKDRRRRNNQQNVRSASKPYYQSGISFHKSRGQHILINPQRLDSMVTKSGIKSTDIILEIGPGTGNLTKMLLEAGKRVIAIEKDPRMFLELENRFQGTPLAHKLAVYYILLSSFLLVILRYVYSAWLHAPYDEASGDFLGHS